MIILRPGSRGIHAHPTLKLGKAPARVDKRTLRFSDYVIKRGLPPAPEERFWGKYVQAWGMMLNDQLGDCVEAGSGHAVQSWTSAAGETATPVDPNTLVTPPDSEIVKCYEIGGGYVPGDASTDQGTDMLSYLTLWRQGKLPIDPIVAFMSFDFTDPVETRQVINLFGGAYFGLAMPNTAQNQVAAPSTGIGWTVPTPAQGGASTPDGSPGSWGGHCVWAPNYHRYGTQPVTWGADQFMSDKFQQIYGDEAYAIVSRLWLHKNTSVAPSGFNLEALLADLAVVTAPKTKQAAA